MCDSGHTSHRRILLFQTLFEPRENAAAVVFPTFKYMGPIWIGISNLLPTEGLNRQRRGDPGDVSICMLFQCKLCTAGVRCNRIHVKRSFLRRTWHAIVSSHNDSCCVEHGREPRNQFRLRHRLDCMRRIDVCGRIESARLSSIWISVPVAVRFIALTCFWEEWLVSSSPSNDSLEFNPVVQLNDVCEPHHEAGGCPLGYQCRRVHICRNVWPSVQCRFRCALPLDADKTEDEAHTPPDEEGVVTPWTLIGQFTNLLQGVCVP